MLKQHSKFFELLLLLMDWVTFSFSWSLSYYLRVYSGIIPVYKGISPFKIYRILLIFMIPLWGIVFKIFGLYRLHRVSTRFSEVVDIGKALTFAIMIFVSLTFLLCQYEFSRLTLLKFNGNHAVCAYCGNEYRMEKESIVPIREECERVKNQK